MASATYNGRTFYTGDTIYFTEYWQNSYNTAAAGVYSNKYSFYATINDLIATGNNRIHNVKFTSLHNTSGTITGGGGYCTPTSITKGYKVTVSYSHNGGSGTSSQFGYVGASLTGTSSRTGYQFAGWYTASSGGSKVTTIPANGTTYYAHWTGNTWYVAFNGNGHTSGSTATETFTYGTAKALTANGFTRTGYQFNGWNTNAAGTGTNYSNGQSVSNLTTTNKGTVNLYAKWLANTYTVIFNGNGALSGSMPDQSFTYDQAQNLSELGFSKGVAYKFTGWNTMPDGTGDSYDDEESVSNLTTTNGGNVVLYAQWELTYIAPTVNNITSIRYENGAEDDAGTQIHIEFDWAADLIVSSTNYISDILVEYKLQSASTWTQLFHKTYSSQSSSSKSGHFSNTSATGKANTDSTYDIRISLTDVYGPSIQIPSPQTVATDFVSTAYFTMDFATGGYGIGIGCPAPNTGLKIEMDTEFAADVTGVDATFTGDTSLGSLDVTEGATIGALDDGYGINDDALLSAATIAKWNSILGITTLNSMASLSPDGLGELSDTMSIDDNQEEVTE